MVTQFIVAVTAKMRDGDIAMHGDIPEGNLCMIV